MDAANIAFAGPGKTDSELMQALAAGILIELESEGELQRLAAAAQRSGYPARVAILINPDFVLKGSGMRLGGGAQQFGVAAERVRQLIGLLAAAGLSFEGLPILAGSTNQRADNISDVQLPTVDLTTGLAGRTTPASP